MTIIRLFLFVSVFGFKVLMGMDFDQRNALEGAKVSSSQHAESFQKPLNKQLREPFVPRVSSASSWPGTRIDPIAQVCFPPYGRDCTESLNFEASLVCYEKALFATPVNLRLDEPAVVYHPDIVLTLARGLFKRPVQWSSYGDSFKLKDMRSGSGLLERNKVRSKEHRSDGASQNILSEPVSFYERFSSDTRKGIYDAVAELAKKGYAPARVLDGQRLIQEGNLEAAQEVLYQATQDGHCYGDFLYRLVNYHEQLKALPASYNASLKEAYQHHIKTKQERKKRYKDDLTKVPFKGGIEELNARYYQDIAIIEHEYQSVRQERLKAHGRAISDCESRYAPLWDFAHSKASYDNLISDYNNEVDLINKTLESYKQEDRKIYNKAISDRTCLFDAQLREASSRPSAAEIISSYKKDMVQINSSYDVSVKKLEADFSTAQIKRDLEFKEALERLSKPFAYSKPMLNGAKQKKFLIFPAVRLLASLYDTGWSMLKKDHQRAYELLRLGTKFYDPISALLLSQRVAPTIAENEWVFHNALRIAGQEFPHVHYARVTRAGAYGNFAKDVDSRAVTKDIINALTYAQNKRDEVSMAKIADAWSILAYENGATNNRAQAGAVLYNYLQDNNVSVAQDTKFFLARAIIQGSDQQSLIILYKDILGSLLEGEVKRDAQPEKPEMSAFNRVTLGDPSEHSVAKVISLLNEIDLRVGELGLTSKFRSIFAGYLARGFIVRSVAKQLLEKNDQAGGLVMLCKQAAFDSETGRADKVFKLLSQERGIEVLHEILKSSFEMDMPVKTDVQKNVFIMLCAKSSIPDKNFIPLCSLLCKELDENINIFLDLCARYGKLTAHDFAKKVMHQITARGKTKNEYVLEHMSFLHKVAHVTGHASLIKLIADAKEQEANSLQDAFVSPTQNLLEGDCMFQDSFAQATALCDKSDSNSLGARCLKAQKALLEKATSDAIGTLEECAQDDYSLPYCVLMLYYLKQSEFENSHRALRKFLQASLPFTHKLDENLYGLVEQALDKISGIEPRELLISRVMLYAHGVRYDTNHIDMVAHYLNQYEAEWNNQESLPDTMELQAYNSFMPITKFMVEEGIVNILSEIILESKDDSAVLRISPYVLPVIAGYCFKNFENKKLDLAGDSGVALIEKIVKKVMMSVIRVYFNSGNELKDSGKISTFLPIICENVHYAFNLIKELSKSSMPESEIVCAAAQLFELVDKCRVPRQMVSISDKSKLNEGTASLFFFPNKIYLSADANLKAFFTKKVAELGGSGNPFLKYCAAKAYEHGLFIDADKKKRQTQKNKGSQMAAAALEKMPLEDRIALLAKN